MKVDQRTIYISNWTRPDERAADVTLWPDRDRGHQFRDLVGRLSLAINCGPASMHLNPTIAEARELVAALQWAIDSGRVS